MKCLLILALALVGFAHAEDCVSPADAMRLMRVTTGNVYDSVAPLEGKEFGRFRRYLSEVYAEPVASTAAQVYGSNEPEHKKTAHVILFSGICAVGEFDLPRQIWTEFAVNPEVGQPKKRAI
jgi:hypothetical protein